MNVDIEFLFRDQLTPGLKKAGNAASDFQTRAQEAAQKVSARLEEQRQVVQDIQVQLAKYKMQLAKMPAGGAQKELAAEVKACEKCLREEQGALAELESEHKKSENTILRLTRRMRELIASMAAMRLNGQQDTEEYKRMAVEAAKLKDTLGDVKMQTKHLADDDGRLKAFSSAVTGLAGGFTAATGALSLFAGENEELARIQTRLQAVMAITMGLQQAFDALNKDSAFSTIFLKNAKEKLTAANTRLATALGITNAQASVLMLTLTAGLSAVIIALIAAWKSYSEAQEKAAERTKILKETEQSAHAQIIKTRFEIQSTMRELKNFSGTKKKEAKVVDELNQKYGQQLGYYKSVHSWYKRLQQAGEDYIQMLFYQMQVQDLLQKAVEADKELSTANDEIRKNENLDFSGRAKKLWRAVQNHPFQAMTGFVGLAKSYFDDDIDLQLNKTTAQKKKDAALKAAEQAQAKAAALQNKLSNNAPDKPTSNKNRYDPSSDLNSLSEAEKAAQQKINENIIALMQEGYEKRKAEAKNQFNEELQRIDKEERQRLALYAKLKKNGAKVDPDGVKKIQNESTTLREQAATLYAKAISAINNEASKEEREKKETFSKEAEELMAKYADFNARRLNEAKRYQEEIRKLEEWKYTTDDPVGVPEAVKAAIRKEKATAIAAAQKEAKATHIKNLAKIDSDQLEELRTGTNAIADLFADMSLKSTKEVLKIIKAIELLQTYIAAKKDEKGTAHIIDKDGKEVQTITQKEVINLGFSAEELAVLERSPEKLKAISDTFDKVKKSLADRSPIRSFIKELEDAFKLLRKGGDSFGPGLEKLGRAISAFLPTLQRFGNDLAAILGNNSMADKINRSVQAFEGVGKTAAGVGQALSGDVVGGAMTAISGISMVSKALDGLFGANYSKYNAAKRQYESYTSVLSTVIDKQKELVNSLDLQNALKSYELGTELIRKSEESARILGRERLNAGASAGSHSIGVRQRKKISQEGQEQARRALGEDKYGKIISGRMTGLFDLSIEDLKKLRNEASVFWAQLDGDVRKYLEDIIKAGESQEEFDKKLKETATGVSFESFRDNFINTIADVTKSAKDAADTISVYIRKKMIDNLVAKKYASRLQALYDDFANSNKEGNLSKSKVAEIRKLANDLAQEIKKDLEEVDKIIPDIAGASQRGQSDAFKSLTHDQGTKLEGMFTAGEMHWAAMDKELQGASKDRVQVGKTLQEIAENSTYLRYLQTIDNRLERVERDGIRVRN